MPNLSGHTEGDIAPILQKLFAELSLLDKILYRNSNQHGRSKVFSPLKAVKRVFDTDMVTSARISLVDIKSAEALSISNEKRSDEPFLANTLLCLKGAEELCQSFKHSIVLLDLSLLGLVEQLRKRVFAPLYSVLLAVSSRLHALCRQLHSRCKRRYRALHSRLQALRPSASASSLQQRSLRRELGDFLDSYALTFASVCGDSSESSGAAARGSASAPSPRRRLQEATDAEKDEDTGADEDEDEGEDVGQAV
eukprot:gene30707-37103_t